MLLSLALTLSLAQFDGGAEDAGTKPFAHAIYGSCPDATDAGLAYHDADAGAWVLPDPRGARQACLLAACEEDRRYRQSPEAKTPTWVWWVTVAADVVIKGGIAIATWGITKAANSPPQSPPP